MTHLDPKALEAAEAAHGKTCGGLLEGRPMANAVLAYLAALPQAEPVAFLSAGQFETLGPDPDDGGGAAYLPIRHTAAGNFQMALFASPTPAVSREVTEEMVERAIQAADPDFYAAAKESGPLTYQRAADSMRRALTAALSQPHSEK